MKKLMMFAAAMTIVGGAYASSDCGDCTDDCSCSIVYEFKASLKTTIAKDIAATDCDSGTCYRQCGSAKIKGYLYYCGACDCTALAGMLFVAKETKSDEYVFGNSDAGVPPTWEILNLIGKKDDDVEALWSVADEDTGWSFTAAGCGSYDTKNDRIKSISGELVGTGPGPSCELSCDDSSVSSITLLCDLTEESDATIAYGSWSVKYHKKYSEQGCTCSDSIPSFKF